MGVPNAEILAGGAGSQARPQRAFLGNNSNFQWTFTSPKIIRFWTLGFGGTLDVKGLVRDTSRAKTWRPGRPKLPRVC